MEESSEPYVIACATVAEELRRLGVPESRMTTLEFGLHVYPEELNKRLQQAIDEVDGDRDILLGYGLCSYAVVGLRSEAHRLVIPRIDDCIALFLGSREEHRRLQAAEPGTYFLTKGWVEAQEGALTEYLRIREKYGDERALKVAKILFGNYTRIALIDTGNYRLDDYREFARGWYRTKFDAPAWTAERTVLRFEAVDYGARVYLNEKYLGEHSGYFAPFEFDVTGLLKPKGMGGTPTARSPSGTTSTWLAG